LVLIPNHNSPSGHLCTTGLTFKNFKCCPYTIRLWFLYNLGKIEASSTVWLYNQTECFKGTVYANTIEIYFHLQDIGIFWLTILGRRAKSTMGISSQVRHWKKIGLNQSLIYTHTHPFPPLSDQLFYLLLFNLVAKKKKILGRENIGDGGGFLPLCPPSSRYQVQRI